MPDSGELPVQVAQLLLPADAVGQRCLRQLLADAVDEAVLRCQGALFRQHQVNASGGGSVRSPTLANANGDGLSKKADFSVSDQGVVFEPDTHCMRRPVESSDDDVECRRSRERAQRGALSRFVFLLDHQGNY